MIEVGLGFLSGLLTSIPMLGPVVLLLLASGLHTSAGARREALALALGAALAEGGHVALVVFGVAPQLLALPGVAVWARVVSGVLLIGIAVVAWRTRAQPRVFEEMGIGRAFVLGLGLVALNPGFTLTWLAVVAALHGVEGGGFVVGAVVGIMTGRAGGAGGRGRGGRGGGPGGAGRGARGGGPGGVARAGAGGGGGG